MIHYSPSITFVPKVDAIGEFMMYIGINTWQDEKCLKHNHILSKHIKTYMSADTNLVTQLQMAFEAADIAYNEIIKYIRDNHLSIIETDAREQAASELPARRT
jgi:hypothetical protein